MVLVVGRALGIGLVNADDIRQERLHRPLKLIQREPLDAVVHSEDDPPPSAAVPLLVGFQCQGPLLSGTDDNAGAPGCPTPRSDPRRQACP